MEKYFYFNYGFYTSDVHGDDVPEGAIELTKDQYVALLEGQSDGQKITPDVNGFPILVDPEVPMEVPAQKERVWRNQELYRSDIELYKVQDADTNAVGTVTAWRDYKKALRAWPQQASFPDSAFRPIAPDVS